MTALSLVAYALGLPAFIAVKVLAPGYYARQDPKTPVVISLVAMGANLTKPLGRVQRPRGGSELCRLVRRARAESSGRAEP